VRIAVVATIGRNGMPQLTPNWFTYANGKLAISTTKERVKYRNLMRTPRLAVCVYSEPLAGNYVAIRGHAEIVDGGAIWPITRAIVVRYVAPEQVEGRMQELRTQNRVIISMTPERVVFR
jgi:PPOX class probable F420-dependent enzyme